MPRIVLQVVKRFRDNIAIGIRMIRDLYRLRLPSVAVDEIEKYRSDVQSLTAAAETHVYLPDDDDLVPMDLRLARGYRTPL